jgi:tetratricopeptide (TPR) repeat protein
MRVLTEGNRASSPAAKRGRAALARGNPRGVTEGNRASSPAAKRGRAALARGNPFGVTLACAAALVAAAAAGAHASPAAAPALELDRGRDSFKRGDWQSAIEVINLLLYPELQLARKEQVVEAHILLGAAYYQTGNRERAREEFQRALEIEPEQSIGTRLYSDGAIRLFEETKTDLRIAKEREDERRRVAQRLADIEAYKKSLIVYETHPYYVNFVPFGAGQFQNRQRGKGLAFAATQAATGGISAGIFLYLASKYGLVSSNVPLEEGRTVRTLQELEIATGALFLGLYAWGVVDALLDYKPRQRVEGENSLLPPELRDLRDPRDPAKTPAQAPPRKTSLRDRVHVHPVLVPHGGAGLGLSLELP